MGGKRHDITAGLRRTSLGAFHTGLAELTVIEGEIVGLESGAAQQKSLVAVDDFCRYTEMTEGLM